MVKRNLKSKSFMERLKNSLKTIGPSTKKHTIIFRDHVESIDYYIFIPFLILSVIGIIMVYSASSNIAIQNGGSPLGYLIRQSIFVIISLVIVSLCLAGNNRFWGSSFIMGSSGILILILLIYLKALGTSVNGSAGWIQLGPIHVQPAEVVKIYIILRLAQFISSREDKIINHDYRGLIFQLLFISSLLLLILIQPDLGGTVINASIVAVMILGSGMNWRGASLVSSISLIGGWILLKILVWTHQGGTTNYQIGRIIAYANPFKYANGVGQQLVNSYYALSNGGIFGVGLGNSIQKTGYLPEPNTDFIMSIIAEELGLIGVLFILLMLATIVVRTIQIGIRSHSTYDSLVCYGIATYMVVQSFFNVGGVIGMLPITGVTFPFVSYGGSSMLTLSICIGMVLVISANQKKQRN